jgi:putative FmdB family regulatory protein
VPIFDEHCRQCDLTFELLVMIRGEYVVECPRCHSRDCERMASTFAMQVAPSHYGSYRGECSKPFENFVVENIHVKDEKTGKNKKLRVNSLAELREAEKKHHFSLDIASMDKPHDDKPPTNEAWAGDIAAASGYEYQWCRDPVERAKAMASPIVNVDVGIARSEEETLAGKIKRGKVA